MTFDWTGTHYLENKVILEVGWAPSQAEFKWKSCQWSTSTSMKASWKQNDNFDNSSTRACSPGMTRRSSACQWSRQDSLKEQTAARALWIPWAWMFFCSDGYRQAVRYPSTEEGHTAFQDKEACGFFKGAPVTNHQPADTIAKNQIGCRGFATQCPVSSAAWPRSNAEGWPWSIWSTSPVFWMLIMHFFLFVHYCIESRIMKVWKELWDHPVKLSIQYYHCNP